MPNDYQQQMYRFINQLAMIAAHHWRRYLKSKNTFSDTYNSLIEAGHFSPVNNPWDSNSLYHLLIKDHVRIPDETSSNGKILLPPIEKESKFIPLLSINWDFGTVNGPEHSFSVDMLGQDNSRPMNHCLLGMRFEKGDITSDHQYFHVQLNKETKCSTRNGAQTWICHNRPCIPINTINKDSPISLLIIIYGSLYGFKSFSKDFISSGIDRKYYEEIKLYVDIEQKLAKRDMPKKI